MSIWTDKKGRLHVGVMVAGARVHRILQEGATKSDAKRLEGEIRGAVERAPKTNKRAIVLPGDPLISEALAKYVLHAASLRSEDSSRYHAMRIEPWAAMYRASQAREFTAHVVKDLSKKIKDPKTGKMVPTYAPATVNRSLATAKKGLAILWAEGVTSENFGLRIENMSVNNAREVFLSVEQVHTIAEHCSEEARAAVWIALLTGARRGEISKIEAHHIGEDTITLPASNTKTARTRVIPIVPALRPWLKYLPLKLSIDGIKSSWRRARVSAKMEHVNFHDLRHSCASILLSQGVDLYTIGEILGHSNVQTTKRYAHLQVEQQRHALNKLSNLILLG